MMVQFLKFKQSIQVKYNFFPVWSRVPHVFIIYQDGLHMDFSTDERISPSNDFPIQLRSSKTKYPPGGFFFQPDHQSTGYLAYADLDKIYIFYTDGKKDVTYIDIRKGVHGTISNTNFGTNLVFASGVQVGPDYFMTSDRLKYDVGPNIQWKVPTYKWTGKKSHIFKHKQYTVSKYTYACYASYNRSHFLRIGMPLNESEVLMIELETMKTTTLTYVPLFVGSFWGYADHRKTCSITFDKQGNKSLIVIAKHPEKSFITTAYDYDVPVYISTIKDSSLALNSPLIYSCQSEAI